MMSSSHPQRPINAFTVDVEDYFQVSGFEGAISRKQWPDFESRVVTSTHRILSIMKQADVCGTFFVLGWVADRFPDLVRCIADAGHEIGSHSYWHRLVYEQTPAQFRADLRRSIDVLQNITGRPVTAYRAPSFSITRRSLWALEILVEEGFKSDSSIFPVYHDRYGIPGAQRQPHLLKTNAGEIMEFPPTVAKVVGLNVPSGGGGYFRLFPGWFTRWCLGQVQEQERRPAMFYIHPWEVDPGQPRLSAAGRMSRFRHYVNLSTTEQKLKDLLKRFEFGSMSDALAAYQVAP